MKKDKSKGNIHKDLVSMAKPLSQVVADPMNARKHGKESIDGIKISLLQYGQVFPVLVKKTGSHTFTCIAGSGRVTAAKDLGWDEIACVEWDGTPEQAKAFALVDNKTAELSFWDSDNLAEAISELIGGPEEETIEALGLKEDLVMAFMEDEEERNGSKDVDDDEPKPAIHKVIIYDTDVANEVMAEIGNLVMKYGDLVEIK